jgi:uncharacterized protein (TIRG00374 family)
MGDGLFALEGKKRVKELLRVFRSPHIRLAFWVIVIGVMLYLALKDVNLSEVSLTLRQADIRFVGLALFSVAINIWGKAARWQVIIGPSGKNIRFMQLLMVLLSGQTLNLFLPGRVGELSRAYVIGGMGPGRTYILGTVAVEKVMDMVAYALLFLLLVVLLPLPGWISESGTSFTVVAALVMLGMVFLAYNPGRFARLLERLTYWLPARVRESFLNRLQAGMESLNIIRRRSDLLKLVVLSVFIWATAVWTNALTFRALDLHLPWTAAALLLAVLQAGISVPSVPGRIGLFQYLCILSLSLFGVSEVVGLSYGILLQAIVFLPTTLLSLAGLWFFGWGSSFKQASGSA